MQPVLSGSYCQYGTGTLDRDVADLSGVIKALKAQRGTKEVAIHGHSTGCQIICHFMKTAAPEIRNMVRLAVLQAPVSDREASPAPDPATLRRAQVLAAAGKGGEIVEVQCVTLPLHTSSSSTPPTLEQTVFWLTRGHWWRARGSATESAAPRQRPLGVGSKQPLPRCADVRTFR